jgi:predicted nucleic acid-binding protein
VDAYFDSGVLVKLYVLEDNSAEAAHAAAGVPQIPLIPLHELEIRNALRALEGRQLIAVDQLQGALAAFDNDIDTRRLFRVSASWSEVYASAEDLSRRHTADVLCRALDLLHVASALSLKCVAFVTADRRQAQLAALAGMAVTEL